MKNEKEELRSLNDELPALFAEELEQRLETDPLGVSGLLNQYGESPDTETMSLNENCTENSCICNDFTFNCGLY